jgi:cytochrome c-type biogenesis protein
VAVFELVVGGVFVVGGLAMATGWKPSGTIVQLPERRRSVSGIFLFGALYAVAAAGCTAPLFLAVVLQGVAVGPVAGAGVAVTYALGMGSVMLVVAGLSVAGSSLVERLGRHTGRLYRLAGGLLVVSGLAEIYYYVRGFPAVIPA